MAPLRKTRKNIGLLAFLIDYIRNVTIPLKGALDIVTPNTLNKLYQALDTVFNGDMENLGVCLFQ